MRKKPKIAINGFGRIGRCILRAYIQNKDNLDIEIVKINCGRGDIHDRAHSFKYDSVHGNVQGVQVKDSNLLSVVGCGVFEMLFETDVKKLDWSGIDIVLECSGKLNSSELSSNHIKGGAKKVIVSAPCKGADATIVLGVNQNILKKEDDIISIGSCTTNCIAPIAHIINNSVGIQSGYMTTIHAYTNDQSLVDAYHNDRRRGRAAALSIIPSSTGAAKSIGTVIPELEGKLDGCAFRVPVPNVSIVDFKFNAKRSTSIEEINDVINEASITSNYSGILSICNEELVSVDFVGSKYSSIFDTTQTSVLKDEKTCRIAAWYDNEFGFANRMLELAALLPKYL